VTRYFRCGSWRHQRRWRRVSRWPTFSTTGGVFTNAFELALAGTLAEA
jgi:hypothetical protein